jgi:CheY-like chemotaxis protein
MLEVQSPDHKQSVEDHEFNLVARLRGASVLLVDDSADNRLLIARDLRLSGANVDLAVNGLEGIKQALGRTYDVIIMDIQMPRIDGFEATRKLREWGYDGSIIALTAHSKIAERDDCLRAGFDDYLTKPVSRVHLLYTVACRPRLRNYEPLQKKIH